MNLLKGQETKGQETSNTESYKYLLRINCLFFFFQTKQYIILIEYNLLIIEINYIKPY